MPTNAYKSPLSEGRVGQLFFLGVFLGHVRWICPVPKFYAKLGSVDETTLIKHYRKDVYDWIGISSTNKCIM